MDAPFPLGLSNSTIINIFFLLHKFHLYLYWFCRWPLSKQIQVTVECISIVNVTLTWADLAAGKLIVYVMPLCDERP